MFDKFLKAVARPVTQVAEGAGKEIERQFQREADRAITRLADRAVQTAARRTVSLFSALAPEVATEEEPAPASSGRPSAINVFSALPSDDEYA